MHPWLHASKHITYQGSIDRLSCGLSPYLPRLRAEQASRAPDLVVACCLQEDEPHPEPKKVAEPAEPSEEEEGEIAEEGEGQAPPPQVCASISGMTARDPHPHVSCRVLPNLWLQALQHPTDASSAAQVCGTCSLTLFGWTSPLCLLLWTTLQPNAVRHHCSGGRSWVEAHHDAQAVLLN